MFRHWQFDLFFAGRAIDSKGRTLAQNWAPHLENTKKFLISSLQGGEELFILGAGRLLDFPLDQLTKLYSKINFYDADFGSYLFCKRLKGKYPNTSSHFIELTGGLNSFKSRLNKFKSIDGIFANKEFLDLVKTKINLNINYYF